MSQIADAVGCSVSTVRRALEVLAQLGLVEITQTRTGDKARPNGASIYTLLDHPWYEGREIDRTPTPLDTGSEKWSSSVVDLRYSTMEQGVIHDGIPKDEMGYSTMESSQIRSVINKKKQQLPPTTDTSVDKPLRGGSSYDNSQDNVGSGDAHVRCSHDAPVVPDAEVEAIIDMVSQCGLTRHAAVQLVAEFGSTVCRSTCEVIKGNLRNGRRIEHSAYKYFKAVATAKFMEAPCQLVDDIRAVDQAQRDAQERNRTIERLRWDARDTDSPEAGLALARLRKISDGCEPGWSDDDRAMAAKALECPTFWEQREIGLNHIRQIRAVLGGRLG